MKIISSVLKTNRTHIKIILNYSFFSPSQILINLILRKNRKKKSSYIIKLDNMKKKFNRYCIFIYLIKVTIKKEHRTDTEKKPILSLLCVFFQKFLKIRN